MKQGRLFLPAIALTSVLGTVPCAGGPLHDAARRGDSDALGRLLADGADLEGRDETDLTPLVIAALAGHRSVVLQLLAGGANPKGRDGNGFTALHAAAHAGHLEIVNVLIARGVDVNDQHNSSRLSPLHAAAERDRRDVALALLAAGADADRKLQNGHTPIFRAVLKAHPEMVKLLREQGSSCSGIGRAEFRDYCMTAGK